MLEEQSQTGLGRAVVSTRALTVQLSGSLLSPSSFFAQGEPFRALPLQMKMVHFKLIFWDGQLCDASDVTGAHNLASCVF